jgi:acyl carrier protein
VALARGYLNRPDLTSELFIPNRFSEAAGSRLYRTGDLARHLEDGNIEFLGRIDHQVKIRGFRVELGEIESVLDQHPSVRRAVVVTREDVSGCKRLVAYIAADRPHSATDEICSYLRERLPAHMVPSAYVIMERLPITPNGKIDRTALNMDKQQAFEQTEELISPRTPAEEVVARIWKEVLDVEQVGINSDFFSLGGHSMLATQIILRLREIFRVELPVRSLFEMPTVDGAVKTISEIWGGREIVEEIAWSFLQVEGLTEDDATEILLQRSSP